MPGAGGIGERLTTLGADRPPSPRARENARLAVEIKAAHERTRQTYGPERLQADLADHGVRVGVHRIKRIRKAAWAGVPAEAQIQGHDESRHDLPVAPNLLDRQFAVAKPNLAWVADITYLATDEGWLYLAGLKDLFVGELVGDALGERMTQDLVMKALFRAVASGGRGRDCCITRIAGASTVPMSTRSCCGDSACRSR